MEIIKQGKRKRQGWGYNVKQVVGEGELYTKEGIPGKSRGKLSQGEWGVECSSQRDWQVQRP